MVDFVGENGDGIWTLLVIDTIRTETGSVLRVGAAAPWGTAIGTQLIFPEDGDGDGVVDTIDNCPTVGNGDQADADADGIGDACDPFPNDADHDKAQCFLDLTQAETDLATCEALPVITDSDGDGEADNTDACPTTPIGPVDQGGCSQAQFCALVDASTASGRRECRASDWMNDEPLGGTHPRDCRVERLTSTCLPQ